MKEFNNLIKTKSGKQLVVVAGSVLAAIVTLYVAYASIQRRNISLSQPGSRPAAANPACRLDLTLRRPTPSPSPSPSPSPTPTPTRSPSPTPKPGVCSLTQVPADHTAVCWQDPQQASITITINSLPNTNPPYYLQTDWYVAAPYEGEHHYNTLPEPLQVGKTYTITGQWPGIPSGAIDAVDLVLGYNVVDADGNSVSSSCSNGFNYYWTPYVDCP